MTGEAVWPGGTGLTLRRRFPDPPAALFQAFTDPDLLRRWWRPHGFRTVALDFTAVEGRPYKVTLYADDGTRWVHEGVFVRVEPVTRLEYTWRWTEGPMSGVDSLVEISFEAAEGGTLVTITHSKFTAADGTDAHLMGWSSALDRLAALAMP